MNIWSNGSPNTHDVGLITPHTSTALTGRYIMFRRSFQFRDVEADLENPDKTMQSTNPHKGLMVLNYNRSFNIFWDNIEIVDKQFRAETSWNLVFYYKWHNKLILIAHNISTISCYIASFIAKKMQKIEEINKLYYKKRTVCSGSSTPGFPKFTWS